MSYAHKTLVLLVSLVCGLAAVSFAAPHVAAANVNISLFGSRTGGWGFTNTSLTIPGPPLTVHVGDNVTLILNATDNRNHNWFIDYNNNSAVNAGEPSSPTFTNTGLPGGSWNFTVSNNTGTFPYRSRVGSDTVTMWGNITILAAEGPGLFGPESNTILVIVGSIVIVVAVLVFATYFWRRMKTPPPPPKQE